MSRPCAATLRPATAEDAAAMAAMSRELIEHGLAWRYTPQRMRALVADPETQAIVAQDSHGIQGFAVMHFGDEKAHLALLGVQPALQRSGIGCRLVDWLLTSAGVAGMASITLELRADNAAALAFYERLGFVQTAFVAGYYSSGIAARRMQRLLRPPG